MGSAAAGISSHFPRADGASARLRPRFRFVTETTYRDFPRRSRAPGEVEPQGKRMLRTPRLTMRPLVSDDADALFAVYGDPEVMRFSIAGAHRSRPDTLGWIRNPLEHQ